MSWAFRSTKTLGWMVAAGLAGAVAFGAAPAAAEYADAMRLASLDAAPVTENATSPPGVQVTARIDISDQTMYVYVAEKLTYIFKVSTGRPGYGTPTGGWNAAWLSPRHRSRKYDNAPMPWAVFFNGGVAVHGTTDLSHLGRIASHGCVRLHPDNAKIFFSLVKSTGKENTFITVVR